MQRWKNKREVRVLFLNVQNRITLSVVYLIAVENAAGELFAFSWSVMVVLHSTLGSELLQAPQLGSSQKAKQDSGVFPPC